MAKRLNPKTIAELTKKKTILVIEDERPLLEIVDEKLKQSGFGVMTARSVDEVFDGNLEKNGLGIISAKSIELALLYLNDLEAIDAIWLDHNLLGKENGLDFVKKLKANGGRWHNIPIFVVSNSDGPKIMKSYVNVGVSKYYVKSNHKLEDIIEDIKVSLDNNLNKAKKDKKKGPKK